jgi:hypothetical protein
MGDPSFRTTPGELEGPRTFLICRGLRAATRDNARGGRRRAPGIVSSLAAFDSVEEQVALKQYEEEYVSSLEAEVHTLLKGRRQLETRIQDLEAEIEQFLSLKKEPPAK